MLLTRSSCLLLSLRWQAALFLVILFRSIYLSLSADFRRYKRLQRPAPPGIAYLQIVYDQTAGVRNIFSSALCRCYQYVARCEDMRCSAAPGKKTADFSVSGERQKVSAGACCTLHGSGLGEVVIDQNALVGWSLRPLDMSDVASPFDI